MKFVSRILIAAFLSIAFMACSDDNGTNNNPDGLKVGEMKCKVDGADWSGMNAMAAKVGETYSISGAKVDFGSMESQSISFAILNAKVGAVSATSASFSITPTMNPLGLKMWQDNSSSITVTVTELTSEHIAGTFSFTATNDDLTPATRTITNGTFKATVKSS